MCFITVSRSILQNLLFDYSRKGHTDSLDNPNHIIWATRDYIEHGSTYYPECSINLEQIGVIKPRYEKSREARQARTRTRAEVFTPSWICNRQNNVIDADWFGREDVFNTTQDKTWRATTEHIAFPEGKTWQEYVELDRLEITCGEAPYLVSRYDAVTGDPIPLEERIGLLDRKLRVVGENTSDTWFLWAKKAYQSTYGYEYQGDNLFLARRNLLETFCDYCERDGGGEPSEAELREIAIIIAWNIVQMDGLTGNLPYGKHEESDEEIGMLDGFVETVETPCLFKDWENDTIVKYSDIKRGG